MSGHDYLKQKLFEALHALVADGNLDKRLTYAGASLAHLYAVEKDIPDKYRDELDAIRKIMFATPLSSERAYTSRQLSDEDARKLAERILSLFTEVMGGL